MSQAGPITIASTSPTIPTSFVADSGGAVPISNVIQIRGGVGSTTSGSGNTITVTVDSIVFQWNDVTGTSVTMVAQNGYVSNNVALVTLTLPASASFGDVFKVVGLGAGGWEIAQNASQKIHFLGLTTATGVGGSLASTGQFDSLELICVVANTEFEVLQPVGNITIV